MKIKIKYNHWFPKFIRRNAITLYQYILISKTKKETKRSSLLNHEWVHILQVKREGFLNFYLSYMGEWIVNLFICFNKAYRNISYEKEARSKEKTIKLPKNL